MKAKEENQNQNGNTFFKEVPEIAWINTKGDSMTCLGTESIPDGAKILIRRIPSNPFEMPLRKPVVLMGEYNGKPFLVCKLITFFDLCHNRVRCESLNKKYQPFWIPLNCITEIFEIEEVILLDNSKVTAYEHIGALSQG